MAACASQTPGGCAVLAVPSWGSLGQETSQAWVKQLGLTANGRGDSEACLRGDSREEQGLVGGAEAAKRGCSEELVAAEASGEEWTTDQKADDPPTHALTQEASPPAHQPLGPPC